MIKEREITQQELSTAKAAVVDSFAAPKWYPQQEEWVRDPKGSDNICFNYPLSLRFEGALDTEALHKALEEIVRRHEVFRSVFSIKDGKLMQNVLENFPVSIFQRRRYSRRIGGFRSSGSSSTPIGSRWRPRSNSPPRAARRFRTHSVSGG